VGGIVVSVSSRGEMIWFGGPLFGVLLLFRGAMQLVLRR
jgi:hypothetical protein